MGKAATRAVASVVEDDEPEVRVYYSHSRELCISVVKGRMETVDGSLVRVGEKHAKFSANIGGGLGHLTDGFGRYETDDPEIIKVLDKRCSVVGDIFDHAGYLRRSVPVAEREDANMRTIESQNKLIAELQEQLGAK